MACGSVPRVVVEGAQEIDVQQLVDEVRERVRRRQSLVGRLAGPPLPSLPLDGDVVRALERLTESWNVYEAPIEPGRGLTAPLVMVKRALRRLLAPVLGRQVTFNAAAARIVGELAEQVDALAARQRDVLEDVLLEQAKTADGLRAEIASLRTAVEALRARAGDR
jgi:hypothetical protein